VKKTTVKAHHPKPATHAKAAARPPSAAELQKEIKSLQTEITHIKHPPPGHKAKHKAVAGHKHKGTAKHGTKKRGLALGDSVACCAAEALAASLRLAGHAVSDEDVMALYWHTADDEDTGASIEATLEAAWRFGLGGVRPVSFNPYARDTAGLAAHDVLGIDELDLAALAVEAHALPPVQREPLLHRPVRQAANDHALILGAGLLEDAADLLDHSDGEQRLTAIGSALGDRPGMREQHILAGDEVARLASVHLGQQPARDLSTGGELRVEPGLVHGGSLILGVELPGPHALLAAPDGLWSWGEPFNPSEWPGMVVEEAWAVSWS
jgi:hypothetical protein